MRHKYADRKEKLLDFWLGFAAWPLVNVALVGIVGQQVPASQQGIAGGALLVGNVIVPIVLAFIRGFIALGMVTAFAAALATVVIGGIFFTVGDFVAGGTGSFSGAIVVWLIGAALILVGMVFALRGIHRSIK